MKRLIATSALLLVLASGACAQDVLTGKIFGQVTDPTGLAMPGVKVTLTSPAELQPLVVTTGDTGEYQFPGLPTGTYSVQFEATGYRTSLHEGIVIDTSFNAEINAKLEIGTLTSKRPFLSGPQSRRFRHGDVLAAVSSVQRNRVR